MEVSPSSIKSGKMKNCFLLLTVISFALGCTKKTMQTTAHHRPDASFENTRWKAVRLPGANPLPAMSDVFIRFDAEKSQAAGNSGCNRFTGKYYREGNTLLAGPFAATRMMCPPDQMAVENAFLKALQEADNFLITGDHLKLMKGKTLLAELEAVYL
jgi:heat shock protein HslJ